jgi:GAF domain-containing protein
MKTRVNRMRKPPADLERHLASCRRELAGAQKHLTEALEQEAATSEILRIIRSSPSEAQPVFDAVAESAARLCESFDSAVWRREGDRLILVAHHGAIPQTGSESFLPLVRGTVGGRSVLDGLAVHIADIQTEGHEFPNTSENARRQGYRTILSVPLMREDVAIGAIVLRRAEARLFNERQIALLKTFADQAVIAIENVRLFEKEQQRTRELSEALEQQSATSQVLQVISGSPGELAPVFEAML